MKKRWTELAIAGGPPAFPEKLHVGRPNIGNRQRFLAETERILDRRWLTNHGPTVAELELRLERYLGVKHCIAMCNGTAALEVGIRALGFAGEVIVPSFTFVATAHSLQWQGIRPVFCDIDPWTHTIDPAQVEQHITPYTTGIVGVHVWGQPCAATQLMAIARRHRLKLLFDASHAFGCSHRGRMVGNFGHAEVFSFHATKFFNTLEGGALVTNDDELAHRVRLIQNFGFGPGYDNVVSIGTNGKMNEVSAAMGLANMDCLDEFIDVNRRNWLAYRRLLRDTPGISLFEYDLNERNNFQYVILEVDEATAGLSRDLLVDLLHHENVLARRYFHPGCHRMEPYRSQQPHAGLLLAQTEELTTRAMALPTGTAVGLDEIETICALIRMAVKNSGALTAKLGRRRVAEKVVAISAG